MRLTRLLSVAALISIVACGDKSDGAADTAGGGEESGDSGASDGGGDDGGGDGGGADVCTEPSEVGCLDDIISDLALHDDKVSTGVVSTSADGSDFVTDVDASAGGYNNAANNPWTYVKFTDAGAERVDIDDETALESMDWDMALRRYMIRLNGGSSGPSCVGAATFHEKTYDDLTEIPDGVSYAFDDFYTDDCSLINDSSGLPDSPQMVLGTWWEYPGCVATTDKPHLVQLADGRIFKLAVEQYYATGQDTCNNRGTPGSNSAQIKMRWRMMN